MPPSTRQSNKRQLSSESKDSESKQKRTRINQDVKPQLKTRSIAVKTPPRAITSNRVAEGKRSRPDYAKVKMLLSLIHQSTRYSLGLYNYYPDDNNRSEMKDEDGFLINYDIDQVIEYYEDVEYYNKRYFSRDTLLLSRNYLDYLQIDDDECECIRLQINFGFIARLAWTDYNKLSSEGKTSYEKLLTEISYGHINTWLPINWPSNSTLLENIVAIKTQAAIILMRKEDCEEQVKKLFFNGYTRNDQLEESGDYLIWTSTFEDDLLLMQKKRYNVLKDMSLEKAIKAFPLQEFQDQIRLFFVTVALSLQYLLDVAQDTKTLVISPQVMSAISMEFDDNLDEMLDSINLPSPQAGRTIMQRCIEKVDKAQQRWIVAVNDSNEDEIEVNSIVETVDKQPKKLSFFTRNKTATRVEWSQNEDNSILDKHQNDIDTDAATLYGTQDDSIAANDDSNDEQEEGVEETEEQETEEQEAEEAEEENSENDRTITTDNPPSVIGLLGERFDDSCNNIISSPVTKDTTKDTAQHKTSTDKANILAKIFKKQHKTSNNKANTLAKIPSPPSNSQKTLKKQMHKSEVVVKSEPAMIIAQSNKVMQSLVNELYNDSVIQEGETDSSFIEQVPQDEQESDAHANQENNYQIKGKSAAKKPALPLSAPSSLAPSLPASPLSVPPVPAMKQKRIPWSDRETEVFIAAVKEFGYSWKDIKFKYGQSDGPLALRSNVQLKDKARNIRAYRLRNKIDLGDFAE